MTEDAWEDWDDLPPRVTFASRVAMWAIIFGLCGMCILAAWQVLGLI